MSNSRLFRLLIMAGGGAVAVLFALRVGGNADQLVLIWPVSGVQLGLLLAFWTPSPRERAWSIFGGAMGVLLAGFAAGMPALLPAPIAILTAIDSVIGCMILGDGIRCFDDLKRTKNVIRLGLCTLVGPILTGLLGALPISVALHKSLLLTGCMHSLADSSGIALILPLMLFVLTGRSLGVEALLRQRPANAVWLVLFPVVTIFVFWQTTRPFLFIIFPPLIAIVVLLGLEGGVIASVIAVQIGWFATNHHHGPIWLNKAAQADERLMTLQVFVWVFLATALPIGATVDERRRVRRELDEANAIYHILVDNSPDMIVLSSLDGSRRYVSPAVKELTGWTPVEYLAMPRLDTLHAEDREIGASLLENLGEGQTEKTARYRTMRKDGSWRWVEASIKGYGNSSGDEHVGYVATVRDITTMKQTEEVWERQNSSLAKENRRVVALATTDGLTGLVNRRGFDDAMAQLQHRRKGDKVALLMMDVDFFKKYNDALGHLQGDECLRRVAMVFAARIQRDGDLVARYGGEEFAVLLQNTDGLGALSVAHQIMRSVNALCLEHPASPFQNVTLSIGVSVSAQATTDTSALITEADCALYESKRAGRNRASLWEDIRLSEQDPLTRNASSETQLDNDAVTLQTS